MVPLTAPFDRASLNTTHRCARGATSAEALRRRSRHRSPPHRRHRIGEVRIRMSRLKGAMLCVAAATLISTPGHAQITGHPIEVSADAGYFHYDIRAYTRDAPGYGGSVGVRLASFASFEGWGIF